MRCRWRELLRAGSRLRVQQRVLTDIVFARLIVPRTPAIASPQIFRRRTPPARDFSLVMQQYLGGKVPRLSPKQEFVEPIGIKLRLRLPFVDRHRTIAVDPCRA